MKLNIRGFITTTVLGSIALAMTLTTPPVVHAQALEEVIVTAQRREQSLMEVPISIEAVSGDKILQQGYRDMVDLSNFTTSVLIDPNHLRNSITVRGFGASTADALTVEQSAPTFVDGVHFGRTNMIKLAFLDVARVEVLKGPQPVYFGQNAISGAFNITSRKPTPEWEGFVDGEIGNFGLLKADAGIGGPITDTLGIRLAGRYDTDDGYLVDIRTRDRFPKYKNIGGRVILQWTPSDVFQATAKFEYTDINKGAEGTSMCLTGSGTIGDFPAGSGTPSAHTGLWADRPVGAGWADGYDHLPLESCDVKTNRGRASTGPWAASPEPMHVLGDGRSFHVDIRDAANQLIGDLYGLSATEGFELMDTTNSYLDLQYTLSSGIVLSSLTGYSEYNRTSNRENRYSPLLANIQIRIEDFESLSQEFRASSPTDGMIQWMVGAYYQGTYQSGIQEALRDNTATGRRLNEFDEEGEWKSIFGTLTFNFMDNKAAIDIGARLTKYAKAAYHEGWGANWIIDDGITPGGVELPWNSRIGNVNHPLSGRSALRIGALMSNQVLRTQFNESLAGGPYDDITEPKGRDAGTEFDPQVVLRYMPTENHSLYAKYVQSFKAGGSDTAIANVVPTYEEFVYDPEYATSYEVGSKGTLLDGRANYTISAFYTKIIDLQTASTRPNELNATLLFGNAGKQEAKGVEVSMNYAATDQWVLGGSAAWLDSVMAEFVSVCTPLEFQTADTGPCISNAESIAQFGNTSAAGRIDRSGEQSANAPKWKVVLNSDYWMPVFDQYRLSLDANAYISAPYHSNPTSFSKVTTWHRHGDLNLILALGDMDDTWTISVYGRNIFHPRQTYNPEEVIVPTGWSTESLYRSNFFSYGVKFKYNFR